MQTSSLCAGALAQLQLLNRDPASALLPASTAKGYERAELQGLASAEGEDAERQRQALVENFTASQVAAGAAAAQGTVTAHATDGHADADGFTDQQWHAVSQHMLSRCDLNEAGSGREPTALDSLFVGRLSCV